MADQQDWFAAVDATADQVPTSESDWFASVDALEPASSHGDEREWPERLHAATAQMVRDHLPAIGAGVAALGSGGAAIPAMALAALGGSAGRIGQVALDRVEGTPTPEGAALVGDVAQTGAVQGALQGVGAGAPRLLTGLGRRMYQGALKPTKAILSRMPNASTLTDTAKAAQLADVGLREGINVSRSGLSKAGETITGLNDEIASALQSSTATVPRQRVIRRLVDPVQRFRDQVTPLDDLRHIARTGREFRAVTRPEIPVQQAQRMKQGTYRALAGKFGGEVKSASAEAQKALARGLKEEIAEAVPGVGALNARESQLLTLRSALEDAVRRTGNRDLFGLTDVVAAGTNPGLLAATLAMRAPVQSGLARVAHRTGEVLSPDALVTALRALLAARPSADERGGAP